MERPEVTIIELEVPAGYREEGRLDVYVTRFVQNASRNKVQQGIREGSVTVNGAVVHRPSHTVQAGDLIVCRLKRPPPLELLPEPIPLDVVYEDDYLIVLNKPAGLVVHPGKGNPAGTLVNALLYHVGSGPVRLEAEEDELDDEEIGLSTVNAVPLHPGEPSARPGIVHRLDKDTSGLMVVAKEDGTHRSLARQFEDRTIQRRYLALVWGVPAKARGTLDTGYGRHPRDRKRMAVVPLEQGKRAVTHYETVEPFAHTALLRFRLQTGRTHQIRVHAQHMGHPVLGDPTYGGRSLLHGPSTGARRAFFAGLFDVLPRQALHAHTLGFYHPARHEDMHFTAPLPEDMQVVLDRLRAVEGTGQARHEGAGPR